MERPRSEGGDPTERSMLERLLWKPTPSEALRMSPFILSFTLVNSSSLIQFFTVGVWYGVALVRLRGKYLGASNPLMTVW